MNQDDEKFFREGGLDALAAAKRIADMQKEPRAVEIGMTIRGLAGAKIGVVFKASPADLRVLYDTTVQYERLFGTSQLPTSHMEVKWPWETDEQWTPARML